MKCLKKKEIFFRSGSDSGISCDDNIRSPVNEVTMENVNIEKNSSQYLDLNTNNSLSELHNKNTLNTAKHDSKLISKDTTEHCRSFNAMDLDNSKVDCENIFKVIQEKLKSHITIKKVKSDISINRHSLPVNLNKGSIIKPNKGTLVTKCLIKNNDEWNKFMLGKTKPTKQKTLKVNLPNKTYPNVFSAIVKENSIDKSLETCTNLLNSQSSEVSNTNNTNSPIKQSKHTTKCSSENTNKVFNRSNSSSSDKKTNSKNLTENHTVPNTCELPDTESNNSFPVRPRTNSVRLCKLNKRYYDADGNNEEIIELKFSNSQHKKRKRITSESSKLGTCNTSGDCNNLKITSTKYSNKSKQCSDYQEKDLNTVKILPPQKKYLDLRHNSNFDELNSESKGSKQCCVNQDNDSTDFSTVKIISQQNKNLDPLNNSNFDQLNSKANDLKKISTNDNNLDLNTSPKKKHLNELNNSNFDKPSSKSKKSKKCTGHEENDSTDLSIGQIILPQQKKIDQLNDSSLISSNSKESRKCSVELNDCNFNKLNLKSTKTKFRKGIVSPHHEINTNSNVEFSCPKDITYKTSSDISENSKKSKNKSPNILRHKEYNESDINESQILEDHHELRNERKTIRCNRRKINHVEENAIIENMEVCTSNTVDQLAMNSNNISPTVTHNLETEGDITIGQLNVTKDTDSQVISNLNKKSDNFTISTPDKKSNCSPHKRRKKDINVIKCSHLENQENTSEVPDNNWEKLRNKYSDFLKCDLNPYVLLTKLVVFSNNDWISKHIKIENISVRNKRNKNSTEREENIALANKNSQSKVKSPVVLRNVCIVLKDLKYDNTKTSKQIKLNRNFNISSRKHRPKIYFRYKFNNNLTSLTSRDLMFSEVQLTEGFKFETPLKFFEILKNDKVYNENVEEQELPEILKTESLLQRSLRKNISSEKKENVCRPEIYIDESIQNIIEPEGSTDTITEVPREKILEIEKPDSLHENEKETKVNEIPPNKFIKKPDKRDELTCIGITRLTQKLVDNKMDKISSNTSVKLSQEYKNKHNKIEPPSSQNMKEVLEENAKEINTIIDGNVKNKPKLIEKIKSMENDNMESESILSIEQFIKDGMKESKMCTINKNKEQKKDNISEPKEQDSQITSSNQQKETVAPKPKHIFKFVDEPNVKRPPTRIKPVRTISSNSFKVPQLSISPSSNKTPYLSPKKEYESPFSSKMKMHDKEFDTISIYAETIEADSVQNYSEVESDLKKYSPQVESDLKKYSSQVESDLKKYSHEIEVNFTKVNNWLNEIKQNTELSNEEQPVKENVNDDDIKMDTKITNVDNSNATKFNKDVEIHEINTENNRTLQNSINHHNNLSILFLGKVCYNIKSEGICSNSRCKFEHELTMLQLELPKLSTADLVDLYETMKKNSFFHAYKYLFSNITECLGYKRDFNKLISMVKDVLEINLNSDRAPFIKNIIDALCSTGVAFYSIVELVYKNANVSEILTNLLRDILLNIIVEQRKANESWAIIKDMINNENYDLDNGIIKYFIVESIENESCTKELCYKIYHDVLKKISDSKLTSLVESLLHNFYCALIKYNYINEAKELCVRCYKLDVNIGPNNDMNPVFSSPETISYSSPNDSTILNSSVVNQSPLQNDSTFNQKFDTIPITADSSKTVNTIVSASNVTTPTIANIDFTKPPPLINLKTELFTVPPPPLITNRSEPEHSTNVYQQKPVFKRYNLPASVSIRSNNPSSLVRPNKISNLYVTSIKPNHSGPPTNTYNSTSPNYALCNKISATTHEVKQAIYEKNVLKIHILITAYKDTDFTDSLIKIVIESILKIDIDFLWFFQELCNTSKCLSTVQDNSLTYVLKTIGLNLVLHLSKNQKWNNAIMIVNILRTNFQDIFNVKIYLDEPYSYYRRILIFARIYAKNKECLKAWALVSETFQDESSSVKHTPADEILRDFIIDEILNVINTTKMWSVGLQILIFLISTGHPGVDIKKRVSAALLHAINSKCGMSYIMEFINSIGTWYIYVSIPVFRSIVAYAVSNEYFEEAIIFYAIGCTYDIYSQIIGNERCITISNQLVLEEIWLIFEIYLRKRQDLGPIKNNVIVKIIEVPPILPIEEIPNNLRQYHIGFYVLRARIANVLNNFIKPAIKIVNEKNFIILKKEEINRHLSLKTTDKSVNT